MKRKFCKTFALIAMVIAMTSLLTIGVSALGDYSVNKPFDVGEATGHASLMYYDAAGGARAEATTSIDRAQLCSVSVTVTGVYYVPDQSEASFYATQEVTGGNGGINACIASINSPTDLWIRVNSTHYASYNGVRASYFLP